MIEAEFHPYDELEPHDKVRVDSSDFKTREKAAKEGLGLDKLIHDPMSYVRYAVAEKGYGLDVLINDREWYVRTAVASRGYGLDVLVNDPEECVRATVARQGYGLDVLVNDKSSTVRQAVATQGFGLDKLVFDLETPVKLAVARQGFGLDVLVNDGDFNIRKAVALQGFGLDKLIADERASVRRAAQKSLREAGLSLADWIRENSEKRALAPNVNISQARDNMEPEAVEMTLEAKLLDHIIKNGSLADKLYLVSQNYRLNELVKSDNWRVRKAVAKQGYGLETLLVDANKEVRLEAARQLSRQEQLDCDGIIPASMLSFEDLELSTHASNVLSDAVIDNGDDKWMSPQYLAQALVDDRAALEADLLKLKKCGVGTVQEIVAAVEKLINNPNIDFNVKDEKFGLIDAQAEKQDSEQVVEPEVHGEGIEGMLDELAKTLGVDPSVQSVEHNLGGFDR